MKITFYGATKTVTGSKYLVEHNNKRILIDCGMFQGYKELRNRNWDQFPFDARKINAVVLTHAHIDHTGCIPLLVKRGFKGKIYCSDATFALCEILLPDSGHLHEEDARHANKYGYTQHSPALPLYTKEDAEKSLEYFQTLDFGKPFDLGGGLHFTLSRSGHILGSSFVSLSDGDKTIVFSGDLGRPDDAVMKSPAIIESADYLVLESTYGDRLHSRIDPMEEIGDVIRKTAARGGTVVIPAFAVGRTQSILYYIQRLKSQNLIPDIPIYLDSPMAINTTELLCNFKNEHRLSEGLCSDVCDVVKYTRSVEESKALDQPNMPSVIISASGMAEGGRVLHHLKYYITDPKNTIMFTGFQAGGTRGDQIVRGEKHVKIHGEMYPVRAAVENLTSLSAHADYEEILLWLRHFKKPPQKVFLTHGEESAAIALKERIEDQLGWTVVIPDYLESEDL